MVPKSERHSKFSIVITISGVPERLVDWDIALEEAGRSSPKCAKESHQKNEPFIISFWTANYEVRFLKCFDLKMLLSTSADPCITWQFAFKRLFPPDRQQRFSGKFPVSSHHELHTMKFMVGSLLNFIDYGVHSINFIVWSTKDHLQANRLRPFAVTSSLQIRTPTPWRAICPRNTFTSFSPNHFQFLKYASCRRIQTFAQVSIREIFFLNHSLWTFSFAILLRYSSWLFSLDILLDCSPWAILLSHSPQTFSLTIFPSDILQDCQINFLKI